MELIGTGIYPLKQAARLVGASPRSVRRWLLGYERKYRGEIRRSEPLWRTQLEDESLPGNPIGFHDLLELRLVAAFARHGVSMQVIRATADAAREQIGTAYPLTTHRFLTDGKRIFHEAVRASGEGPMEDLLRKQYVFADIIKPSLYAGIEYDGNNPLRWYPQRSKAIVLDPNLQFGTPALAEAGIPTDTIYASYLAEEKDRGAVARIFEITPKLVTAAVEFEERLAA